MFNNRYQYLIIVKFAGKHKYIIVFMLIWLQKSFANISYRKQIFAFFANKSYRI